MELNKVAFGKRLREHRMNSGYTSKEFAAVVGVSQIHINEIERGKKTPSFETYIKMCNALRISSDHLIRDSLAVPSDLVCGEIADKIKKLSSRNANMVNDVLDAMLNNLEEIE